MKKIIYIILAFAGILTSCSNDDIEVIAYGDLTYTVSTQTVYDEFGVSDQFKGNFLSGDYNIGVWTFLYDNNGNLAASDSVFVKTFGQIERNFSYLPAGEYTAISVEMMVKESEGNISESFVIVGQEKLSTIQIARRKYYSAWYSAVGVATNVIQIANGKNQRVDITPHAIGAYVDFIAANFDCSNYLCVSFYTKNHPDGRYLSPEKKGEDRFYYKNYLNPNTWAERGYLYYKSSDQFPNEAFGTAYLLEEGDVNCVFGAQTAEQLDNSKFTPTKDAGYNLKVEDGKSYFGAICYTGSKIEGKLFDDYSYLSFQEWYNGLNIKLYADPYLEWGASLKTVNSYMNNAAMDFSEEEEISNAYTSSWYNKRKSVFYKYYFDTNKTNLNQLLMMFSQSYTLESILASLKEQYSYEGYNEAKGIYNFVGNGTGVMVLNSENVTAVLYYQLLSPITIIDVKEMKKNAHTYRGYLNN